MKTQAFRKRIISLQMKAHGETKPVRHAKRPIGKKNLLREKLLAHRVRLTGQKTLPTVAGIQSITMLTRDLEGGRARFLEIVQLAQMEGREPAQRFWHVFRDLSVTQRTDVNFDDICLAAGVKPRDLIGAMLDAFYENAIPAARLIRASFLPKITSVLATSALRMDSEIGERDRARFLQAEGVIPAPKGTVIQVSANAQAAASAALDSSVPEFAEDMQSLAGLRSALPPRTIVTEASE